LLSRLACWLQPHRQTKKQPKLRVLRKTKLKARLARFYVVFAFSCREEAFKIQKSNSLALQYKQLGEEVENNRLALRLLIYDKLCRGSSIT
jgi:hypothetical protein